MDEYWGLRRSTSDAPIAGVCGGIAARWQVDPLVVRLAMVLAMLSAGVGVVVYVAAVLLLPTDLGGQPHLEKMHPAAHQWPKRTVLAVVAVTALVLAGIAGSIFPFSVMPALVMLGAWYFGVYLPRQRPHQTAGQSPAALPETLSGSSAYQPASYEPSVTAAQPTTAAPAPSQVAPPTGRVRQNPQFFPHYRQVPPPATTTPDFGYLATLVRQPAAKAAPPPTPDPALRPAARRWRWGILATMAISIVVMVLMHLVITPVPLAIGFAVPAIIGSIGLIVATWLGRARGMFAPTVIATFAALLAAAPHYVDVDFSGFSQPASRTVYTELPDTITSDLRDIDADLTQLSITGDEHLAVTNQLGRVILRLPDDVTVVVVARSEVGNLYNAATQERVTDIPARATWEFPADEDAPELTIDVSTALGDVEVYR